MTNLVFNWQPTSLYRNFAVCVLLLHSWVDAPTVVYYEVIFHNLLMKFMDTGCEPTSVRFRGLFIMPASLSYLSGSSLAV